MRDRRRMTWAAGERRAAAPPATPGYGVEDQDHPARHQDDPDSEDYMIGGPSEFAEDIHPGPYDTAEAPALPGYGVEDEDHPAHKKNPGGRRAALEASARRKSAKAVAVASRLLGANAKEADLEEQALGLMDLPESTLDATLQRIGGGFLAADEDPLLGFDEFDDGLGLDDPLLDDGLDDPLLDDGLDDPLLDDPLLDDPMDDLGGSVYSQLLDRMASMQKELNALKRANQNDPKGETLAPSIGDAEDVKKEQKEVTKQARIASLFDASDTDGDGFVMREDWKGPMKLFASLDTDGDGILARHEVVATEVLSPAEMGAVASDEEMELLAEALADDDTLLGMDDEIACGDDGVLGCGDGMGLTAADEDESEEAEEKETQEAGEDSEDESDESDKEAALEDGFFTGGFDPMSLDADSDRLLTAEDQKAFESVFGRFASEDDADEAEEAEAKPAEKEASRTAHLRPQPRRPATGATKIPAVKVASGPKSDIDELSKLWKSAPDVSDKF